MILLKINKLPKIALLTVALYSFFVSFVYAEIINRDNPQQGWKDNRAYKPYPVLFLHGFAAGGPDSLKEDGVDQFFNQFYSKYYTGYNPDPTILPSTRYPYLELIDFGSSLIDRNSSVDTYKSGDRYVLSRQRNPGDPGWSDKLSIAVDRLRESYRNRDGSSPEIILVAHSMGGLAARKYLKDYNSANQKIKKLIMIGTPNLGSLLAASITVPYSRNRHWGSFIFPSAWMSSATQATVDILLLYGLSIDGHGDAVWDMDASPRGSDFINNLNNSYLVQFNVDHFAIAGNHWLGFNAGDGISSLDSQLGINIIGLKGYIIISATHWQETAFCSREADNPLLKFLDSDNPELELTSPAPGSTTDISGNSFTITGKVYKEYLPADSKLMVKIAKQDDGSQLPDQEFFLKASDLWQPNNPDSPVAEFDEKLIFSTSGTYKVSCFVKNPAGLVSDSKDFLVTVVSTGRTSIIVHAHNPEGKEIASILNYSIAMPGTNIIVPIGIYNDIPIYDGNSLIGYSAYNAQTHNKPITLSAGKHNIKVEFNGMILEENIDIQDKETKVLTFTFTRQEYNIKEWVDSLKIEGFIDAVGASQQHSLAVHQQLLLSASSYNESSSASAYIKVTGSYCHGKVTKTGEGEASIDNRGPWLPCRIGGGSGFAMWYLQQYIYKCYIRISGWFEGEELPFSFISDYWKSNVNNPDYHYRHLTIPVDKIVAHYYISNPSWGYRWTTRNPNESWWDQEGTIVVKMSSVPYDLRGDAV